MYKIGDILKSHCICCDEEEIWEVESIKENDKYLDGLFRTYKLKSIKNCMGVEVRTSVKDCECVLKSMGIEKTASPIKRRKQ